MPKRLLLVLALAVPALMRAQTIEPVIISNLPQADPLPTPVELSTPSVAAPPKAASPPPLVFSEPDEDAIARQHALRLRSAAALVVDQQEGQLLYAKNTDAVMPIASITKLMTAMVVLDSGVPLDDMITIGPTDVDLLKGTRSRLKVGVTLSRRELLKLALMASENRAAAALARSHTGGTYMFVEAMNQKARNLGMYDTRFLDATGLNPRNVSTAQDLAVMVNAGYQYPLIREFTTSESHRVALPERRYARVVSFRNSNGLVRSKQWEIGLSKTGYISEAGRCLVMQATIAAKPVIIVLLDSWGKLSRVGDANRIKRWVEGLVFGTPPAGTRRPRIS
ncbi:MAG TPA: D-alanyl-D-alanine endopeptidase [Burkholderiales bacterium]|nr:D-alanyl-D-alanine endopeptidase [Burkholderiales bacterium]